VSSGARIGAGALAAPGGGGTYYVRARGLASGTTVGVSASISN